MSPLFQAADAPRRILEHVRALVPELSISAHIKRPVRWSAEDASQAGALAVNGYATLLNGAPQPTALVHGIGRLVDDGLPAVFAYLFDDAWSLGESLRARLSEMLGRPYALAEDGWSWQVEPGQDGWSAHRDDSRLLDRTAPERVNVWVALTDAPVDRSCIHVVPLNDDEHYPNALSRSEAPAAQTRQLPVAAGTALAWNANLLHWGGRCAPEATGPRVAISYTLVRINAADQMQIPLLDLDKLSPERRLDTIAWFITKYDHKTLLDVSTDVHAWAKATCTLRMALAKLKADR